jgi:hypothetical protein
MATTGNNHLSVRKFDHCAADLEPSFEHFSRCFEPGTTRLKHLDRSELASGVALVRTTYYEHPSIAQSDCSMFIARNCEAAGGNGFPGFRVEDLSGSSRR